MLRHDEAEAIVMVVAALGTMADQAKRRPRLEGIDAARSTAIGPGPPGRGSRWIRHLVRISVVPVPAPLPNVACRGLQAPRIGFFQADGMVQVDAVV